MTSKITELAYQGNWPELLQLLELQPSLVNLASQKGYSPLHQAAWHGAAPRIVGALLALGADPTARTRELEQSPADIALVRHPAREDLQFLLHAGGRTPTQLLRKLVAEHPDLFESYDGNQVVCDRVLECLSSGHAQRTELDVGQRLLAAIHAVTGQAFFETGKLVIGNSPFDMKASRSLWLDKIIPSVVDMSSNAHLISLERAYTVMSDLFDPEPTQWGLRGDPFLWREMRQALCHVPIPGDEMTVQRIVLACFTSLTGEELRRDKNLGVKRYSRGGMSSGMVCGETWSDNLLPKLRDRARWLFNAWGQNARGES